MARRSTIVTIAAVASALALAGCSSGGGGGESGDATITFLGWGSPQEVEVFENLIGQFEDKYPDVTVDYISVAPEDFSTKLQTMISSGNTPDVFYLTPENTMPFADSGIIADMTDYVADNDIFDEANVWAKALDMYRYDGTTPGEGAIYGLPKDIGPFALAYNKDLFAAAGIPEPDPDTPWTWDEFIANAKLLTSGEGDAKVYGSAPYSVESAVWSNGADWLNADHTEVTVTDPAFVEALQWVADLSLVEGVVPSADEESALPSFQRFLDGRIGMMGVGPWNQGQFWTDLDFEWDLMPWPVSPATGEQAIWYGGIGFAAASSSKNLEAAENLAAFLAFNEDAQRTNFELGQAIPNLIDMAENEYLALDKPPANKQQFLNIIESVGRRATQTYTYNSEWFGLFNSNLASVWLGEMTAQEYTESIQEEMQGMLDEGIAEQNSQ
jgi:ABC-type glycerol-3-phosphate transport system substrate-binding protein